MRLSPDAERMYTQLQQQFRAPGAKDPAIAQLLVKLKLSLAQSSLLMPSLTDQSAIDTEALAKARDILEIGAFYSVRTQDIPAFERYISQLGPYYNDYGSILPLSQRRYPLVGLDLLRLLSQNKIAQFHTVLEGLVKEHGKKKYRYSSYQPIYFTSGQFRTMVDGRELLESLGCSITNANGGVPLLC